MLRMVIFIIAFAQLSLITTAHAESGKAIIKESMTIVQATPGSHPLEVLWIIDDSGSMGDVQNNISDLSQTFLNEFSPYVDWKMAMITTDIDRSPIGFDSVLTNFTANPQTVFSSWVNQLGVNGTGWERPTDSLSKAVMANPDFFQPDANLAIVLVTDEDDQSEVAIQDLMATLRGLKSENAQISFYPIISTTEACLNSETNFIYSGSRIQTLTLTFGAQPIPLCTFGKIEAQDLSHKLISSVAAIKENRTFQLSEIPELSTLKLNYNGKELPQGIPGIGFWLYDYQVNSIYIHDMSFKNSNMDHVEITYYQR